MKINIFKLYLLGAIRTIKLTICLVHGAGNFPFSMKNAVLFVLATFFYRALLAGGEINYIDKGRTDSLIRSKYPGLPLSESYYVFLYPLLGATTTFAPPIIKEYKNLTTDGVKKCDEDILFIFKNNGGIAEHLIPEYFKQVFLMNDEQIKGIRYIVDDNLYDQLNLGGELAKLLYVYRSKLVYHKTCKLHGINSVALPHEAFNIKPGSKTEINGDSIMLLERDPLTRYKPGKLLLLTDVKDMLLEIDIKTAQITHSFSLRNFDPTAFYCRYIARGDTARCNFAASYSERLKSSNRKSLDIMKVVYNYPYIYCFVSVEAFERNKGIYAMHNDENKRVTIKNNESTLTAYGVMLKLDSNFNLVKAVPVQDLAYHKKGIFSTYVVFDEGFAINQTGNVIAQNVFVPTPHVPKPALSSFAFTDTLLRFDFNLKPLASHNEQDKCTSQSLKTFFYSAAGQSYFSYDVFGNIYDLNTGKIVSRLRGDGSEPYKKEVYHAHVEQVFAEKSNYNIHDISGIYGGKYLAAIYRFKGKPILEIKDERLGTVDVIELRKIPGLDKYFRNINRNDILIQDDSLYFISLEHDKYFLNTYLINKACP
jgi:hypothetical protein